MGSILLDELGDQTCPTCLVAGAESFAGITVEVFVEQQVIAEMGIVLKQSAVAEHGFVSVCVGQEETAETAGELRGSVTEIHLLSGASWKLDLE